MPLRRASAPKTTSPASVKGRGDPGRLGVEADECIDASPVNLCVGPLARGSPSGSTAIRVFSPPESSPLGQERSGS